MLRDEGVQTRMAAMEVERRGQSPYSVETGFPEGPEVRYERVKSEGDSKVLASSNWKNLLPPL